MIKSLRSHFNKAVIRRKARVFVVAVFVLSYLGPIGTYEAFSLPERVAYWGTLVLVNGFIFELTVPWFLYDKSLSRKLSRWPRFCFGILCGSFIATWVVILVEFVTRAPIEIALVPFVFMSVTIIASIIGIVSFMPPFVQSAESSAGPDIDFQRIEFFEKHPKLKGLRIHWVEMEDHYARVVTEAQQHLLHITMTDLERQLENYPGMRIHRSIWVAYDQVGSVSRQGRAMHVTVNDGTDLPVGTTYRKRVDRFMEERR